MGFEACNASLAIRPFQKSLTNSKHSSKFNRRLTLTVTSLSSAVVLTPNFISNRTLVKRSRRKKLINALHNCKGILKQANWCLKILTTLVEYHYQCAYQRLMHAHQTKFISVHWLVEATCTEGRLQHVFSWQNSSWSYHIWRYILHTYKFTTPASFTFTQPEHFRVRYNSFGILENWNN